MKNKTQTKIPIITGNDPQSHTVIDSIFALDNQKAGMFSGVDVNKAFEGVKGQLRKQCVQLGGDAVVSCHFEHRVALSDNGKRQILEFFAYGTVIKYA